MSVRTALILIAPSSEPRPTRLPTLAARTSLPTAPVSPASYACTLRVLTVTDQGISHNVVLQDPKGVQGLRGQPNPRPGTLVTPRMRNRSLCVVTQRSLNKFS